MDLEDLNLGFDPTKLKMDPEFKPPDMIGTVEGWRVWNVSADPQHFGVGPKLYSVSHGDYYWTPRKASYATCPGGFFDEESGRPMCKQSTKDNPIEVPGEQCSCGFYSAKTLPHLQQMSYHNYDAERGSYAVLGQLANWGKVIEGTQGWRAQIAYPAVLYVPFEAARVLAKPLAESYGVPVKLLNLLRAHRENPS